METCSALLAICAGNSPVTEFPAQRPVTRSFCVFFDLCLSKRLSKNGMTGDLRRHCADYDVILMNMSTGNMAQTIQDLTKIYYWLPHREIVPNRGHLNMAHPIFTLEIYIPKTTQRDAFYFETSPEVC